MPKPPCLPELQRQFAAALVDGAAPALEPWIDARGIAPTARLRIYRHAVFAIHVEALATTFPAVRRLLGEDCFDGLATRHAARRGSRGGNLQGLGADFAAFLEDQAEVAPWAWVGDVARLEWLRQESALADRDPRPAAGALIAAIGAAQGDVCLRLQPHVRVLSAAVPVLDLWRHAQPRTEAATVDPAGAAQAVLLWRETDQVAMRAVTPAQAAFVRALRAGAALGAASDAARTVDPPVASQALLSPLLEHALIGAVVAAFPVEESQT